MFLPNHIENCIRLLENAGFEAWVVGGCVRDAWLGIQPHDYDLCTSALPEEIQAVFRDYPMFLAGVKHGTVSVLADGEVVEITTFRTEGDYRDSRHPGWVRFVRRVEEDLSRRDFTINAMAFSPDRGFADPFGGRDDLQKGILRAVGEPSRRFREDALRILRGARFAARFRLTIDPETRAAMDGEIEGLDHLAAERIYSELTQFLCLCQWEDLVEMASILARVIPELGPCIGFDQKNPHHEFDIFTHIAHVVETVPAEPVLRWAALLHDIGKPGCFSLDEREIGHFYGHAAKSVELADTILRRLKTPTALREEVIFLVEHHMDQYPAEEKTARRCLSRHGLSRMEQLLILQAADGGETGELLEMLRNLAQKEGELTLKTLAVKGGDLIALGLAPGKELGNMLNRLLQAVLAGELPNEKAALLDQAKMWR